MVKSADFKTPFKEWCVNNRFIAEDIASEIGCSKKAVYAWLQGYRKPSRDMMIAMEQKLGIDRKIFD